MAKRRKPVVVELEEDKLKGLADSKKSSAKEMELKKEEIVLESDQWKVKSGGITLRDRRSFSKGETFWEVEENIPNAFMDILEKITPEKEAPKRIKAVFTLKEVVPTAEEQDDPNYVQLYNIIDSNDKVISESPLEEGNAKAILKGINQ